MKFMENLKKKKANNKGFSLVELIIVIAIMAILVGIVGTQVIPYLNKSKEAKDFQIINSYSTAAMTAYSSNAEKVTETTTIVVYGTNTDEVDAATGASTKPAKTLETEIKTLVGYASAGDLQKKMGSDKGTTIGAVKIVIDLTNKTITTQAYKETACTNAVFDPIVSQL